jgi:hypothetical protein
MSWATLLPRITPPVVGGGVVEARLDARVDDLSKRLGESVWSTRTDEPSLRKSASRPVQLRLRDQRAWRQNGAPASPSRPGPNLA